MPERQLYAAIDLGSNSFHMIVARHEHGELRVIDRIRDMVRLAGGLDDQGRLDPGLREEALACLARFGQRIAGIPDHQVRAVGTQTFRRLRNPAAFLVVAETALGCPIDIISGREEARLVYLGVAQGMPPAGGRRLVIDIGGGSTEIVVGEKLEPELAESLAFGCVSMTRSAFADGRISARRWQRASQDIRSELQAYSAAFRDYGWQQAVGSSGTIRAVGSILSELQPGGASGITQENLVGLRERLIGSGRAERIELPGLSERRRPVIAGGVLILEAVMDALRIERLQVSPFALREGLLYDLMGRLEHRDPREQSVLAMAERYQVDRGQAERLDDWTHTAFEQVAEDWKLAPIHADLLHWICQLHEIGLAISHDAYQLHTAYILEHADMAGFSRSEQQFLAIIARLHRRRINPSELEALPPRLQRPARYLLCLLRLGLALHRPRGNIQLSDFAVQAGAERIELMLPAGFLENQALTRRDLALEQQQLKRIGIELKFGTLTGEQA
jgi:exopolyphosphatase / guanosine-5'-triphosphate,3'-diphosphate pyrophosphatase